MVKNTLIVWNLISMSNILIDKLPTQYKGYLINYHFKSGILLSECLSDNSFKSADEQIYTAFRILFGKGIPEFNVAMNGLKWFLHGGDEPLNDSNDCCETLFSFSQDKTMIFSAFMLKYGINLNESNLHFFEFLALFNDLDKTAFRKIIDLRALKPSDMKSFSKEQKYQIYKLKQKFALGVKND